MTAIEFVKWAQSYYAPYPDGQKADIWRYVKDLAPDYLAALKDAVIRNYSSKWGRPPDIAIFEQCRPLAESQLAYKTYLPAPEETEDLITPEQAARFFEAFNNLVQKVRE